MAIECEHAYVATYDCTLPKQFAWPSGLERRFYDGHDHKVDGSTPTQASLLRPWIRCFTTIISAWRNLTSSKLKKLKTNFKRKTGKQRVTFGASLDSSYA